MVSGGQRNPCKHKDLDCGECFAFALSLCQAVAAQQPLASFAKTVSEYHDIPRTAAPMTWSGAPKDDFCRGRQIKVGGSDPPTLPSGVFSFLGDLFGDRVDFHDGSAHFQGATLVPIPVWVWQLTAFGSRVNSGATGPICKESPRCLCLEQQVEIV